MNYLECKDKLKQYLLARIPLIYIDTIEKSRVISMLNEIANETNLSIYVNSMSKGTIDIKSKEKLDESKNSVSVLDYFCNQIKMKENLTLVFTDISNIDVENTLSRYLYDVVTMSEERNASLVVIKDSPIWANLQRLGMGLQLDLPNTDELYKLIRETINYYRDSITISWSDEDYKDAATILLGFSEIEVKNILSSLIAKGDITKDDLVELKYAKDDMFDDISGLEKIDVDDDLKFAGLENLNSWLDEKGKLMLPSKREKMEQMNIRPPRGILVVGVPGCGKSLTAKVISNKWQLPLYLLDFATVQGSYVGQSERQLKEALLMAEQVSPCILWIDEIEKGLAGKSDSGVTTKMIGQFLFWLQECKKEVFVVATANDISLLPIELFRKGRFDEIFFVDLPSDNERKSIIKLYLNKYLNVNITDGLMQKIVEMTVGFSGADIESTIRDIAYKVVAGDLKLTQEYLIDKFSNTLSVSKTSPTVIENIRKWGTEHAISASKND